MSKTLNRVLSVLLVLLMIFGPASVAGTEIDFSMSVDSKAYSFSSGKFSYKVNVEENGTEFVSIVRYTGSLMDVETPSSVDGLPVKEILDGAFKDTKAVTVTVYGDDVTIHKEAFAQSKIQTVEIKAKKSKILGLKSHFYLKTLNVYSENTEVSIEGADALKTVYCSGEVKSFTGITMENRPMTITFVGNYPKGFMSQISGLGYLYSINPTTKERIFFRDKKAAAPYDEETGFSYMIDEQDKAVIVDYKGKNETVIIPDEIAGKPVCAIDDNALENKLFIRNVVLGENVVRIGNSAFKNCQWLSKITFNDKIESIGASAFEECEALKEITIPEKVKEIKERTFFNCGMLPLVIAKGVEKIGAEAFANDDGCTSLTKVEFSENLHTVEYAAFKNCSLLTNIGVSGEKITTIGESAFENAGIRSFTFSADLKEIPHNAFSGTAIEEITFCEGVEKVGGFAKTNIRKINLPSTIKVIEPSAFEECTQLRDIVFPDGLIGIGDKAFYKCSSLVLGSLPDSLITIGESAFNSCGKIGNSITIPENITFIGNNAFCLTGISEVYFNAVNCRKTEGAFDNITKAVIGENVTRIPDSLFKNCGSLKTVIIPDSVTEIGEHAFSGCENLEEITIPKGITAFDRSVIEECSSLKTIYYNAVNCKFTGLHDLVLYGNIVVGKESPFKVAEKVNIVLGDDVQVIPAYMYSGITVINNITLPSSVTSIGEEAFAHSSIKEITLPDNLEVIEKKAFYNTDVRISGSRFPEKLLSIGEQAFRNCNELTEIYIPDNIELIGDYAFCSCYNLAKVRMSPKMKTISDFAFAECGRLSEFIWEAETKAIGKDAFRNCKNLTDFDFASVEKIGESSFVGSGVNSVQLGESKNGEANSLSVIEVAAFENCTNFKVLNIGGNVTTIKSGAFANCRKLEIAVISPEVTDIAADAFDGCESLTICCVENSYAHKYALDNHIPVSIFALNKIPAQIYTGKAITPQVTVELSDKTLEENTDFTLDFSDNVNVGTAKILVSGKGKYKGLTLEAEFEISAKSVADITVSPIENQAYTGEEIIPEIIVTSNGVILEEGVDYKVEYFNNTEPGTGKVEITGMGNYSGKTTVTFEILKQTFWQKIVSFFKMIIESIRNFFVSIFG